MASQQTINDQWGVRTSSATATNTQQQNNDNDPYAASGILGPWSAASAELLGDLALTNKEKAKKLKKRPKDRPKRPLSAYNIFFKEERQRILTEIPDVDASSSPAGADGNKKKPHGKISFQSLAKIIGKRWQNLSKDQINLYKKKAEEDTMRYKKEMDAYLASSSKSG